MLLFILLRRWWCPLLLLSLRLGRHNLHFLQTSPDTINGHTLHDRLVLGTVDISKFVHQRLVWLRWKKVDLLGHLDRLWWFELTEQGLPLAWLVF